MSAMWSALARAEVQFALLGLLLCFVWWFRGWYKDVNYDRKRLGESNASIKDDVKDIKKGFEDVKRIVFLMAGRVLPPEAIIQRNSPLQLTEYGKNLSRQIDGEALAVRLAESAWTEAKHKEEHELQNFSSRYVYDYFELNPVHEKEVEKLTYESDLTRPEIYQILTIELRDVLVAKLKQAR